MKRTRRYGGFVVGDRVRPKDKATFDVIGEVVVDGYLKGGIRVKLNAPIQFDNIDFPIDYMSFMPNQLINLTRIEEEKVGKFLNKAINDGVLEIPLTEEEAKDIIAKKQKEYSDKLDNKINELFSGEGEMLISEFSYDPDNPKSPKDMADNLPYPYSNDVYTSSKDF